MKKLIGLLVLVPFLAVAQNPALDQYWNAEGAYWMQGVPNDHQRYTSLCGVFRQDENSRQVAVVYIDKFDVNKNEITGTPVDSNTVVEIVSDDLEYHYAALGVSRLCAEIPAIITEATAEGFRNGATPEAMLNAISGKKTLDKVAK